jgi:hypothetical protein
VFVLAKEQYPSALTAQGAAEVPFEEEFTMRVRLISIMAVVAVAAPVVGVTVAAGASHKRHTHKVSMSAYGKAKIAGNKVTARVKGKPFGNCKSNNVVVVPKLNFTWKCKGGSVKGVFTVTTPLSSDAVKASWKITSGTGKFKGAKGSGKMKGRLSTNKQISTGTVKY